MEKLDLEPRPCQHAEDRAPHPLPHGPGRPALLRQPIIGGTRSAPPAGFFGPTRPPPPPPHTAAPPATPAIPAQGVLTAYLTVSVTRPIRPRKTVGRVRVSYLVKKTKRGKEKQEEENNTKKT